MTEPTPRILNCTFVHARGWGWNRYAIKLNSEFFTVRFLPRTMRRKKNLHKTRFRYASKPVILTAICCGDGTCTSNSQLLLYTLGGWGWNGLQYNILQFGGIEANALFKTGLLALAAYLAADYSSLSSEGNGSSYSSSSHTVVKGVEQGLYLCRLGPFAIGVPSMHHLHIPWDLSTMILRPWCVRLDWYITSNLCHTQWRMPHHVHCPKWRLAAGTGKCAQRPRFKVQHSDDGCCPFLVICLLCFNMIAQLSHSKLGQIFLQFIPYCWSIAARIQSESSTITLLLLNTKVRINNCVCSVFFIFILLFFV